jgi:prepilin-type N-terminal cleavage/methylation domain-containing protein
MRPQYINKGFTLIELIIVIVVVAILAIIVLPKFVDLSQDAQAAATKSVAGSLSAANAENYAVRIEKNTNGGPVTNCNSVAALLMSGLPSGYTITSNAVTVNHTVICTLNGPAGTSAEFNATGIL